MTDYAATIGKFAELYRSVDRHEIVEAWQRCVNPDLHVYLHTPFCASVCKFCYYKGVEFDATREEEVYQRYFDDYLPRCIDPFLSVIESKTIRNYFFGGGTPSLMSIETMEDLFARLPRFRETRSKTFEIHPAVWTEEQIDLLADHGFNCCIVGVQSYDPEVLARQNRLSATPESIHRLVSLIREKGMTVAGDLIYYMDRIDADRIFREDLRFAAESDFDILSLQLNYDLMKSDHLTERFFDMIMASPLADRYYWERNDEKELSLKFKQTLKCIRLIRKGIPLEEYRGNLFNFVPTMDEGSKQVGWTGVRPSSIGFGSYRNPRKNTFSNIRDHSSLFEYIEVNDDWEPRYFCVYEWREEQFFEDAVRELNRLRGIGPPPRGMKISLEHKLDVKNENHIIRDPGSQAELSVSWEYRDEAIDRYIEQLKNLFPHWKWR